MNTLLMRAVLESMIFLELADDEVLNPDVAVTQLEQLSAILQQMTQQDRQRLVAFAREIAAEEQQRLRSKDRVSFLLSLGENLNIED